MWELNNKTEFAVGSSWLRDINGAETWLVVVKASFQIDSTNGQLTVEDPQSDVPMTALYTGDEGKSSLLEDDPFVLSKPSTDIILNAHCYAPGGKPSSQVDVAIQIGRLQKHLRVSGDRFWQKNSFGFSASEPSAFTKMPITYERAFGGDDLSQKNTEKLPEYYESNPLGVGFSTDKTFLVNQALPNIEYPDKLVTKPQACPPTAGLGAIASDWQPRAGFHGSYDDIWMKQRRPLLPMDMDVRCYQQAPLDQQYMGYLKGGELVTLHNLTAPEKTPEQRLTFKLPQLRFGFKTFFKDGVENHRANLHTLLIEPDDLRVSLVWHTALECHNRDHLLESTTVYQKDLIDG